MFLGVVKFQGAKVNAHLRGRYGVARVPSHAVTDETEADRLISALREQVFHTPAVVLIGEHPESGPVYYGRADAVRFLEKLDLTKIQWAEYTLK